MEDNIIKIDDNLVYTIVSCSEKKITLKRYDEKTGKYFIFELEDDKNLEKNIVQILSNLYINRLTGLAQLHK